MGQTGHLKPSKTVKIEEARNRKLISDQAVQIAQFASQALEV